MLLQRIERHLRLRRMTPTRFGREALGDPNFVLNLKDGREPRLKTVRKVEAYIEAHEPAHQSGLVR